MAPLPGCVNVHPVTAAPSPEWPSSATTPPEGAAPAVRAAAAPAPGEPIPAHYPYCFGCGPEHPTGLHLQVRAGEGVSVTATWTVTQHHQGIPGLTHGGLLATAFDETMGFLLWVAGTPAVTGRLETDFVAPVPIGATLHLQCECLGVERRKVYVRGEARLGSPDGPVAVRSAGVFIAVPPDHVSRSFAP